MSSAAEKAATQKLDYATFLTFILADGHLTRIAQRLTPKPVPSPSTVTWTVDCRGSSARAMAERDATGADRGPRWGDSGRERGRKRIYRNTPRV